MRAVTLKISFQGPPYSAIFNLPLLFKRKIPFMLQFLLFSFLFAMGFCDSLQASPFSEWQHQNVKEYAKTLTESSLKTSAGSHKEATLSRIREAKAQQKWPVAIAELESLVGQTPQDMSLWLDLALTAFRGAVEGQPAAAVVAAAVGTRGG